VGDVIIFIVGGVCVAVVYLVMTVQRHERALQFFQEELQRREHVASWSELNSDED